MSNRDSDDGLSRRAMLRATAAATAATPLATGVVAADEHDGPLAPADDQPPTPQQAFFGYTCDPESTEEYTEISAPKTHDFGEELTLELPSEADGEKIQMGVLLPEPNEEGETFPVVLRATPYVDDLRNTSLRDCQRVGRLTENFVERGYAVAAVAVRGTGGSGGCMELFGATEQADVNQAVTHLGEADYSNGNVAIVGRSYDGTTPWMAARAGNPYLKTIVPYSGVPDVFELMYKRGAPEQRGYAVLPALYYVISLGEHGPNTGTGLATYLSRAQCPDNYAAGSAWSVYSGATGERDPSGYWTERVLKPGVAENYEGSVLLVHGLQDWNVDPSQVYPWAAELREAGIDVRYYLGQFGHHYPDDSRIAEMPAFNPEWADYLYAWFEQELKEEDVTGEFDTIEGTFDPIPEAYVQNSAGEWYTAQSWPPAVADETVRALRADGTIGESSDATGEGTVRFTGSRSGTPAPGSEGTVTFEGPVRDEAFRFAGVPELDLTVTPTGPASHLTATLYTVDGEGTATRLGWGQVDLRYAEERPDAATVVPGEPLSLNLPIEPLDAVVPAGERLVVVLHQGTVSGREPSPTPTPVTVETGGDATLTLEAWTPSEESGDDEGPPRGPPEDVPADPRTGN